VIRNLVVRIVVFTFSSGASFTASQFTGSWWWILSSVVVTTAAVYSTARLLILLQVRDID